jgi:hypothetical protein
MQLAWNELGRVDFMINNFRQNYGFALAIRSSNAG